MIDNAAQVIPEVAGNIAAAVEEEIILKLPVAHAAEGIKKQRSRNIEAERGRKEGWKERGKKEGRKGLEWMGGYLNRYGLEGDSMC